MACQNNRTPRIPFYHNQESPKNGKLTRVFKSLQINIHTVFHHYRCNSPASVICNRPLFSRTDGIFECQILDDTRKALGTFIIADLLPGVGANLNRFRGLNRKQLNRFGFTYKHLIDLQ